MAQVKYLGHSCFEVHTGGKTLIFDPFIRPNELATNIQFEALKADYILVSHAHADHVADLMELTDQTGALVIGSWEIHNWVNANGYEKTHPMNAGGKWQFDFGQVKMTPAVHSSSFPDGADGGSPMGFVIKNDEECFYYAGDTALFSDMQLISRFYDLDFAFLPIGDNFTMDAEEAAIAAEFIHCNTIIGMHFDTFGFVKIDHDQAGNVFSKAGKTLNLLEIGESRVF